jgi:hypothetical protein
MARPNQYSLAAALLLATLAIPTVAQVQQPRLFRQRIAAANFGADAPWFLENIPFLEIDDPEIQQIYYYRWKLYRSHIREIGPQGTDVLEFLPDVPWAREPYTDLNDSSSFHLLEGRWLRSPVTIDNLIDHLYAGAGNDRHFSESIAAAAVATTLVTGDPSPALKHLDAMQYIFNAWDDHFDRARNLYWIEPLLDATEYTISSIDASGAGFTDHPSTDQNRNGFTQGYAFRPSINSYQFANALAIAYLLKLSGKPNLADDYTNRAEAIRKAVLDQLWNPSLQHFTDRYQRSTPTVEKGTFVRGRELLGYTPWFYELPPKQQATSYETAWKHLLSATELAGPQGLRTVEPSYPKYLEQYRYDLSTGLRECQWNGPSWPFQTSQALTAMANLLDDYHPSNIQAADYLALLRQYTHQHFLTPGHPDLQEDYNPDNGGPIVGLPRSHHYNHSTYNDLVISGLIGVRPRADEILELAPLIPTQPALDTRPIHFFALTNLRYHGHDVGIFYDQDGSRYHLGSGLSIFVDGKRISGPTPLRHTEIKLPPKPPTQPEPRRVDLVVNPGGVLDLPTATASSSESAEKRDEAIDGRLWFFPEIANGWSPTDPTPKSWYAIHFAKPRTLGSVELYFFADDKQFAAPAAYTLQIETAAGWADIPNQMLSSPAPIAGGENRVRFPALSTQDLRITFTKPSGGRTFRLIEIEAFAP